MPNSYFGLETDPFVSTSESDGFVDLPTHREALSGLVDWAQSGDGIALLTAPAGLGKSLVCERLTGELEEEFVTLKLADGNYASLRELLQTMLFQLDLPYAGLDDHELRLELWNVVKELASAGHSLLLIVDEAHELSEELLKELKTLATGGAGNGPQISLLLSGQLELEEMLAHRSLSALNQRVKCHQILEPLSRGESADYLSARLEIAGADVETIFDEDAVELITHVSDGVPRCLNMIAESCIRLATTREVKPITEQIVRDCFDKVRHLPLHWNDLPETASLEGIESTDPGSIATEKTSVEWDIASNDSSLVADAEDPAPSEQLEDEPVEYATAEFGDGLEEPEIDLGDTQIINKLDPNKPDANKQDEELPPPQPIIDMGDLVSEFDPEFDKEDDFPPIPDEQRVRQVAEDVLELAESVPDGTSMPADSGVAPQTPASDAESSDSTRRKPVASPRRNPVDIFATDIPETARDARDSSVAARAPHLDRAPIRPDESVAASESGQTWEPVTPESAMEYDAIEPELRSVTRRRQSGHSLSPPTTPSNQRYGSLFSKLMRRRKD